MKDFITKKGIYVAIAAIVIAIIAAISVALSGGNADFAATLSQPFFKPLKNAMASLVGTLERTYNYMYNYDNIVAENTSLKARISELEEEYREYTEISDENRRLRELLGFSERHQDLVFEPATVISWTASNFSSSFTISKGSYSGVSLYDAVVTETGYLIGQITEVTASSATVTTIIDTTMSIGAQIYETGDTALTEGDFQLFKDELLMLTYLGDADVIIGNTVVTSGNGGVFPNGLVIGYIDAVSTDSSGLEPYAIVAPAAEISESAYVYVITDFAVSD